PRTRCCILSFPTRRSSDLLSAALAQSLDLVEPTQKTAICKMAIEAAPANRAAWLALAAECSKQDAPPAAVAEVASVVERFAIGRDRKSTRLNSSHRTTSYA